MVIIAKYDFLAKNQINFLLPFKLYINNKWLSNYSMYILFPIINFIFQVLHAYLFLKVKGVYLRQAIFSSYYLSHSLGFSLSRLLIKLCMLPIRNIKIFYFILRMQIIRHYVLPLLAPKRNSHKYCIHHMHYWNLLHTIFLLHLKHAFILIYSSLQLNPNRNFLLLFLESLLMP